MAENLKPLHESVVDAINRAGVAGLETLAQLIKETEIPKGHDAIVTAWTKRCEELGIDRVYGVAESLIIQKEEVEAEEARKVAEGAVS